MTEKIFAVILFLLLPQIAWADSQWVLDQSTLTYHVSHPLHEADGVSHDAAKGKGICHAGKCKFLLAVPVKSFDSGNSNRDLHMLQVTLGAQFPLVVVRFTLPESELTASTVHADLEIQFAGQKAEYKQVVFQRVAKGGETEVTGTIPLQLSDFEIKRPELLGIAIKNEAPVKVDTTWRQE
jgi:hypothetical protein